MLSDAMRDASLKRVEVVTHSAEDNRFCLVEHLLNVGYTSKLLRMADGK